VDKGSAFEMSSRLGRNSFWLTAQTAITGLCGLIVSMALARMLGPEEYGRYSYVIWLMGVIVLIASYGLPSAMTRYIADCYTVDSVAAKSIFGGILRAGALIALAVALVFSASAAYPDLRLQRLIIALIALQIVPMVMGRLYSSAAAGIQKYELNARIALVTNPLQAVLLILAVGQGYALTGILTVLLAVNIIQWIMSVFLLRPFFRFQRSGASIPLAPELKQRIRSFAFTVFLLAILDAVVWQKSEILFLERFSTLKEISFYSLAFTLTYMMMQIPAGCSNVLFPAFSELFGHSETGKLRKGYAAATKILALLTVPIGLAGMVAAPAIIGLLYGPEYASSARLLQMLLIAGMVTTFNRPVSSILYSTERQSIILRVSIALAIVNIILDVSLIPFFGAMGAVWANNIAQMTGVAVGLYYLKKYLAYTYPARAIVRIFICAIASAALVYILLRIAPFHPAFVLAIVSITYPLFYILFLKRIMIWEPVDATLFLGLLDRLPARLQTMGRFVCAAAGLDLDEKGSAAPKA